MMQRAAIFGFAVLPAISAVRYARHRDDIEGPEVQGTVKGCSCTTYCDATIFEGCDTCKTSDGCGSWGLTGRWDYCDFSPVSSFESQSWTSKQSYYWNKITANTARLPDSEVVDILSGLSIAVMTSFDNYLPEMPVGRKKSIHGIGSVCQIRWDIGTSPYTGLLGRGVQKGFIRMGNAVDYSYGLTPGLGFKFPRSKIHSGDFVALNTLDFDQGWNFFARNMSNHIPPGAGLQLALTAKFEQSSQCPPQVGLSDMAMYSQNGTKHSDPKFPFKLYLVPSQEAQMDLAEKTADQLHAIIDNFAVGTTLYTVYGCNSAKGDEMRPADGSVESTCGSPTLLGKIKTTSKCTTSSYGDRSFHIRHQRIEDDWKLKPEYMEQGSYQAQDACGRNRWDHIVTADGAPEPCGLDSMLSSDA